MTIDEIIKLAREAGGYDEFTSPPTDWNKGDFVISPEQLSKFATLVRNEALEALKAEIEALRAEVERLKSMTAVTTGVGRGDEARLIAAAPELLAALTEIVAAADGDGWKQLDPTFTAARAAIAKATGKQGWRRRWKISGAAAA